MRIRLEHLPADVVGLSGLARAALAKGVEFGPLPVPRRAANIPQPLERHDKGGRQLLVRELRRGLERFDPPERSLTSLNLLEREGVFAVVTGQQPGLACSPLYSLYKAMQACRLAHELSLAWGRPVVPLFWNHADDHDIAEVHHCVVVNHNLDLQRVALAGLSSGRQPISRIVLDDEPHRLSAVAQLLLQLHGDSPQVEEALELFFPRAGETLANAMTRAFTALLGEHGLVVIEPDWVRGPLSRALASVVSAEPALALSEGAAALAAAGFEPAIDPSTAALVYHHDEGGRRALRLGGEGFRYDGERGSRTAHELAAEIVQDLDDWSAGALLRPLVQDSVLPVAAYIGGWGELAYHAELAPARSLLGLPRTPFVPRVSCTVVDPETRLSLDKLGASVEQVLRAGGSFEPEVDATGQPAGPEVIGRLRESARVAAEELLQHRAELGELDRALAVNLKRTADQVTKLVDKLVTKASRVHENQSGKGRRHVRRVNNVLFPTGRPQERVLGPFPFGARWGRAWVDALYAELPPLSSEHLVVQVSPGAEEDS